MDQQAHCVSAGLDPEQRRLIERLVAEQVSRQLSLEKNNPAASASSKNVAEANAADHVTIVAFSGDMDKLMATFIIAIGAAAMGAEVSIFFTFWGLAAMKKKTVYKSKTFLEKVLSVMLPSGPGRLSTSKMNMLGIGPVFFKTMMKKQNVQSLPELIELAKASGVGMTACEMTMGVMGLHREELIDGMESGGVASFLGQAMDSHVTLFV